MISLHVDAHKERKQGHADRGAGPQHEDLDETRDERKQVIHLRRPRRRSTHDQTRRPTGHQTARVCPATNAKTSYEPPRSI